MQTIVLTVVMVPSFLVMAGCSGTPDGRSAEPSASAASAIEREGSRGALFTLSNDASANAVLAFERASSGSITAAATYPTGGQGTGAGLGSQGALVLGEDGRLLFAVDAGSNEVSSFAVDGASLRFVSRISSGGTTPISVAAGRGRLYVLNGGSATVTALGVDQRGVLSPIPGASVALTSPNAGGAEVAVGPGGRFLVVTEKATSLIDFIPLGEDGLPGAVQSHPSSGTTPFGFAFDDRGDLIVSEAFGATAGASAVSSYDVDTHGGFTVISPSVADHQTAACWIAVTRNGRFAYTTNAHSSSISGYAVEGHGALSLLDASGQAGLTPSGTIPTDMALDHGSRHLYALDAGSSIAVFDVDSSTGALTAREVVGGLPASVVGIATR